MREPKPIRRKEKLVVGKKYIMTGLTPEGKLHLERSVFEGPSSYPILITVRGRRKHYRRAFEATRTTESFLRKLGRRKDVLGAWLNLLGTPDTPSAREAVQLAASEWYDA